ncbi:carotenoid oxygenase family protein [Lentzea californiensis]|uniref:carotenoid oxygenase family protein n=1 Tax=Lentzea californiensis TaxID=438851 RepID=UPI0021650593|nr:carotenoid oxygenase family protein [Lentzea californiensis]MCR3752191.1 carotenoid cleavage dioxygenase [Lentzea californiensis]
MEALLVEGSLPANLRGRFLQSVPHPAHGADPVSITGVRLSGGTAAWHRARADHSLLGTVPSLAPAVRDGLRVARPMQDPRTGEWHTIATRPGSPLAEHVTMSASGAVRRGRCFVLSGPARIDTVALTPDHVVVFDLSMVHDRAAELVGLRTPFAWRSSKQARIGLLPRRSRGNPLWFPVSPCFVPDAVHAFEDGQEVVVDALRQTSPAGPRELIRWTLDLVTGEVNEEFLTYADFAIARADGHGQRGHEIYGTADTTVFRHGEATYSFGAGHRLGQPALADGWLVVPMRHGASSDLAVFDATDLAAGPISVVRLPVTVPVATRTTWQPLLHPVR